MDAGVVVVTGLCALLVVWYGGAYLYNRRRGRHLLRWLEAGIGVLGAEWEAGWLGSPATGARINVIHAAPPFRRLELTLVVLSREILPVWLIKHLRGNQDRLIIRATLRTPQRCELEINPSKGQIAMGLRREQEQPWTWEEEGPAHLAIAHRGSHPEQRVSGLSAWLAMYGVHLDRLSLRPRDPHLQVQLGLTRLDTLPSDKLLAGLQEAIAAAIRTESN